MLKGKKVKGRKNVISVRLNQFSYFAENFVGTEYSGQHILSNLV